MVELIFHKIDAMLDSDIQPMARKETKIIAFKKDVPLHPELPGWDL